MAKSSGLVACVQLFQMAFSLLRNKFVALLIGASGFGVWSLYQTFTEMVTSFSVFGLDQGGVREIAKSSDNREQIGKCIFTFRLAILVSSVFFGLIVFLFSLPISRYIFNSGDYSSGIKILSLTVVFYGISRGGYSVLNGVHALRYLAFSQVISAITGSLGAILIVYFFHVEGVAVALSVVFVTSAVVTGLYIKKLRIGSCVPSWKEFRLCLKKLLFLGVGFTVANLVSTLMTLQARSFLSTHYSLDSVGIYQASWTISNLYIGIILTAMGIDLMPRLCKVSDDNEKMNELINQQIEFGITIASIGAVLILVFSSLVLTALYSAEFAPGVSIIRWQILGVVMRVIAFPFGYAIMAKGKPLLYASVQVIFWVTDYLLLVFFSDRWGFGALGINYFVAYMLYLTMAYWACKRQHGFRFSPSAGRIIISSGGFILFFWTISRYLNGWSLYLPGGAVFLIQLRWMNLVLKQQMGIDVVQLIRNKIFKRNRP